MRSSWSIVTALVLVSAPAAAEDVQRVTAPEALVKAPKAVGRRYLTGTITSDSTLETFTLQRLGDRALLSTDAVRAENDGTKMGAWTKVSLIQYLGTSTTEGDVTTFKFSNKSLKLEWRCTKTKVDVAVASAVRVRGSRKAPDCDPGRWQPASTQKVEVLHCVPTDMLPEGGAPLSDSAMNQSVAFSAAPGIEWLHVNDDCELQGGGWRKVVPKGTLAPVRAK